MQAVDTNPVIIGSWPEDEDLVQGGVRKGVVRFNGMISADVGVNDELLAALTITVQRGGERMAVLTKPLRFGTDQRRYAIMFDVPEGAGDPHVTLSHKSASFVILNREIITANATVAYDSPTEYRVARTNFDPLWVQDADTLSVTWLGDTYSATMPDGFDLEKVPSDRIELAGELLFGEIERAVFGRSRKLLEVARAGSPQEFELGQRSKVLLCFSAGEDSTAALKLLPPERTVAYYNERPYDTYFTPSGAEIKLHSAYEKSMIRLVPGLVRVLNNFELIGLSVGMSRGYRDSFGYAAVAVLIAHHLGCNVVAFGSVMEQIFMKSGCNYSDVVNYKSARLVAYRSLFRDVGMYFSVPTGALSEILTHRITKGNRHGYMAVPCPSTSPDGQPCGTCFKCFRKLRLDHGSDAPDPSPSAIKLITARPMKSATSVVAAAQTAGETRFGLEEYANADMSFLERYYREGLKGLVPDDLLGDLEAALSDRGIFPMTLEDEYRLRTVAHVFDPGKFSLKHAFPGSQMGRFSSFLSSDNRQ